MAARGDERPVFKGWRVRRPRAWVPVAAAALLLLLPAAARATTYYAAPGTGNTSGCTTPQTACEIHYAIGTAPQADGDEVVVEPGTYDAGNDAITASKAIAIHGQPGLPVPEIDGATLINTGAALLQLDGGAGTAVSDLKLVQTSNFGPPAALFDTAGGARIERVFAETTPGATGLGIGLGNGDVLADSVAWADGGGVAVYMAVPGSARVENVTAYGGVGIEALSVFSPAAVSLTVENTIAHGSLYDLEAYGSPPPENGTATIEVGYSNFSTSATGVNGTIDPAEGHNQSQPPALEDPGNGDFHELPSSPTVDAGVASPFAGPEDLDGLPRSLGAAPDIGAYELAVPPEVATGAAQASSREATLNGSVDPEGLPLSSCAFEYGTGTAYGSSVPCAQGSGGAPVDVSAHLAGLAPATIYHYRLVATNASGTATGQDATFATAARHTLAVAKAGTGSGTVTSSPGGIDCGSRCTRAYDAGTAVTLTATPSPGSTFAGWGGACSGTGACQVRMDDGHDVSATFTANRSPKAPRAAPGTKVTRATIRSKQRAATFRFKAIGHARGFQCALKRPHHKARFRKCTSPKRYRHLAKGHYVFKVRAVGPGGKDASPAKKRFAIK